ncbi:hypothetical protein G6L37_00665 [Agrobacterium rubi]|nr:hypothetical protein [Agrobacterium rubi]NTF23902.1 hypothetical protein [Agrobacterium rubi]
MSKEIEEETGELAGVASEKPSSQEICILVSLLSLGGAIGWATGLFAWAFGNHAFGSLIVCLLVGALVLSGFKGVMASNGALAFSSAATVGVICAAVMGWLEILQEGSFRDIPFLVGFLPGIAVQVTLGAVVFCVFYHDKELAKLRGHVVMSTQAAIWLSMAAFLVMLALSWSVDDFRKSEARQSERRAAYDVEVSKEHHAAIASGTWKCEYSNGKAAVTCVAPR